ncbi:MAG: DrmB family protein [Nitrososphaeria archaeon]
MTSFKVNSMKMRPSEFVLTYGPGSIIETRRGPRLIPMPNMIISSRGTPGSKLIHKLIQNPNDYSIPLPPNALPSLNVKIYRLPSSEESLRDNSDRTIWNTIIFPEYFICNSDHNGNGNYLFKLDKLDSDSFDWSRGVPKCPKCGSSEHVSAVRFVMACNMGHLDDVNWIEAIHGRDSKCRSTGFWWKGSGSMSRITIKCEKCRATKKLYDVYNSKLTCTCRYPEKDYFPHSNCKPHEARVVHRQASNLRIPLSYTHFYVPPFATDIYRFFSRDAFLHVFSTLDPSQVSFEKVYSAVNVFDKHLALELSEFCRLNNCYSKIGEVAELFRKILSGKVDILETEFRGLLKALEEGYPPQTYSLNERKQVLFEADKNEVKHLEPNAGTRFSRRYAVLPIKKLHVVIYQKGYQRLINPETSEPEGLQPQTVDIGMSVDKDVWYPGVEFTSEGLFITLEPHNGSVFRDFTKQNSRRWSEWLEAYNSCRESCAGYPELLFKNQKKRVETHPLFVWWHTLSHLLIREISIYAGYSSASIRERIYADPDAQEPYAGILLYANEPGSEGTLGGLVSLVNKFDLIMNRAVARSLSCSNDPACRESRFVPRKSVSGAACYACSLVSETSCEHRNAWLDRMLLVEVPP